MARTIEPVFTEETGEITMRLSFKVVDDDLDLSFPIGPDDFRHISDLTDEAIMDVIDRKARALARQKGRSS